MQLKMNDTFSEIAKWIGLFGGALGMILTVCQCCIMIKPPKHELSIQIPKTTINNSNIQFGIVLRNTGDFNEITTGIGFYFVENFNSSGKENYIQIAEYYKMLIVDSKKKVNEIIEGKIDLNRE